MNVVYEVNVVNVIHEVNEVGSTRRTCEGGLVESSVVLNEVRKDVVKYVARRVDII